MDKETVLIVEGNQQLAQLLEHELHPNLGYDVHVTHDGKSAVELVQNQPVSLILLDEHLPDMSGIDLIQQLASQSSNTPIIMVTDNQSEHITNDSLDWGVQDYLVRPLDADLLNQAISRALSESRLKREKLDLAEQLSEQVSLQEVLSKIGQSVTSSLDLDEVLKRIVEAGVQLTQAEEGFLALLDENSEQLFLRAAKNIDEARSKTMRLPVTDNLIGEVMRTQKAVRTTSQSTQDEPIKLSTGFLVRSLLHVPIISRGKSLGVLSMVNHFSQRPFMEKDEALLFALAGYAAIALDNASLYEQAQQEILVRRRVEEALRESEERYALAMRGSNDGLWDWDMRTNLVYFSPRWKSMVGYSEDEFGHSPQAWFSRVHPDDVEKLQIDLQSHLDGNTPHFENDHRILHKDGSYRWFQSRGIAVWDNDQRATRIAGSITDITERKLAEQKLLHYAFYDKLTNLPNRALFIDHLGLAIERAKRKSDYQYAVLFLDLDRFKDVNDSLGHMVGDELIIAVGRLIQNRMRATDTVARFGGDEFVILLDDIRGKQNAIQIADWINTALSMPFYLNQHEVYITASIGIVLSETGYQRPEDVLRDADIAMYNAKSHGKAVYQVFDPSMRTRLIDRLELASDLRRAIENQELCAHYQVIVSLITGQIIGLEALVRWQHPQRGLLPPGDFISLAEDTGWIIAIDRWMLREACRQLYAWQTEFSAFSDLSVSVNISGKHINQPDFISFVKNTLEEAGLKPIHLTLEITESVIVENKDATVEICNQLKELGVKIQIDDFGIGYSSLSYLSQFPISALKIDQSFVRKMSENSNETNIVHAIVSLSRRLGVGVIAEGVETENQLKQLQEVGCEYGQGYYVSRPLDSLSTKSFLLKSFDPKQKNNTNL